MSGHENLVSAAPAPHSAVGRFVGATDPPIEGPGTLEPTPLLAGDLTDGGRGFYRINGPPPPRPPTSRGTPSFCSRLASCCDWFFCCRCGSRAVPREEGGGFGGDVELKPTTDPGGRDPPVTPGPGEPPVPTAPGDDDPAGVQPTPLDPVTGISRLEAVRIDAAGAGPGPWNRRRHRTAEYWGVGRGAAPGAAPEAGPRLPGARPLVTRRGARLLLHVTFSRAPRADVDHVAVELEMGSQPKLNKGTHIVLPVETRAAHTSDSDDDDDDDAVPAAWWGPLGVDGVAGGEDGGPRRRAVWMRVGSDCPVGRWRVHVSTQGPAGPHRSARDEPADVYVIFNPWCRNDAVYMEEEAWRREYVLADTGRIYYGTEQQIGSRPWNFGQFERDVLEASVMMMDVAELPLAGRGNPVNVVRTISAMVNSLDDDGVLVGNWSGDYSGGTAPTAWNGSVDILQQYAGTRRPVAYGQCWVFSGVTTTVLRSLGIPTRSVTNFASAHDTDTSLTTDVYLDEDLQPIEHLNTDSIWNFHVWNDCWMARPDLPDGLGGWQAVDATPQETSSGVFCCGPASVEAIKNGLVYLSHDTPFVFAEVNSDRIFWLRARDGTVTRLDVERGAIGHCVSTKAVGSDAREDVTLLYKYPEGSEEERIAVETACLHGSRPDTYRGVATEADVSVAVATSERIVMGEDFNVSVRVSSAAASDERRVSVFVRGMVMHYTGVTRGPAVKQTKLEVTLQPGEERELSVPVLHSEYLDRLVDQSAMMFLVSARVAPTGAILTKQHCFRLCTPKLRVMCASEGRVGEDLTVEVHFENPLPRTLRGVTFHMEGPGLQGPCVINHGDVSRGASVRLRRTLVPLRPGDRKLLVSLHCPQLSQVHGEADMRVSA